MIKSKEKMASAAEAKIQMAKKEFYPDFTIGASYFARSSQFPDMWNLTATINIPIFYKTKQKEGVLEAEASLLEAKRDIESAKLICELFKLPAPILDARLNAIDYGNFKGQPLSSIRPPHDYIEMPYPGGESWLDCLARWRSFFEEVLITYNGQPVLLAGQTRAAIRMCAHLCDGMRLSDAVDLELTDPKVPWVYFYKF
jgi:hypothetical protein